MKILRTSAVAAAFGVWTCSGNFVGSRGALAEDLAHQAAKIGGEIRVVEQKVAQALRGHPEALREEESLLHEAEDLVRHRHSDVPAAKHAVSEKPAPHSSAAKVLGGFAHSEEELARAGLMEMDEARQVKEEIVEALGKQDPSTAARVETMMDQVRRQQSALVNEEEQAARTAELSARESHHHPIQALAATAARMQHATSKAAAVASAGAQLGAFVREESRGALAEDLAHQAAKIGGEIRVVEQKVAQALRGHPKALREEESLLHEAEDLVRHRHSDVPAAKHAVSEKPAPHSSAAKVLGGFAHSEEELARAGLLEMDEARQVKEEIVEALGKQDPSTAARVETLMDQVRRQQSALVNEEDQAARTAERLARESHHHPIQALAATAARMQHATSKAAAVASAGAQLGAFAREESNLANNDRSTYHMLKLVAGQALQALGSSKAADNVARLLGIAEQDQRDVAMSEHHEAKQEERLAEEIVAEHVHVHRLHHKQDKEQQQRVHQQHREQKRTEKRRDRKQRRHQERQQQDEEQHQQQHHEHEGRHSAKQHHEQKHTEELHHQQQHREHSKGQLHKPAKLVGSHKIRHLNKYQRRAASLAGLVEERAAGGAGETSQMSLFRRFTREAHRLRVKTSEEQKFAHQAFRVADETARARDAVHKALAGTLEGAEVGELLREAEGAAEAAARGQRAEAEATKRGIHSMVKLEQKLRGTVQ